MLTTAPSTNSSSTELALLTQNFDFLGKRLKRKKEEEEFLSEQIEKTTNERNALLEEVKDLQLEIEDEKIKKKDLLVFDELASRVFLLPATKDSELQLQEIKQEIEHSIREVLEIQNTINEERKFITKIFLDLHESSQRISAKLSFQ